MDILNYIEIRKAIESMKLNKASGIDQIQSEILKADTGVFLSRFLFRNEYFLPEGINDGQEYPIYFPGMIIYIPGII